MGLSDSSSEGQLLRVDAGLLCMPLRYILEYIQNLENTKQICM